MPTKEERQNFVDNATIRLTAYIRNHWPKHEVQTVMEGVKQYFDDTMREINTPDIALWNYPVLDTLDSREAERFLASISEDTGILD
jgi:hypothetical protein